MSIFVFIAAIIIAYFVVRIGAAAFELTGLDPEQSHFQSLYAFSGTGFTTREAELIVVHKQRRKIASVLMILGNAGLATLIATLANSIRPDATSFIIIPAAVSRISLTIFRKFFQSFRCASGLQIFLQPSLLPLLPSLCPFPCPSESRRRRGPAHSRSPV